MHRFEAEVKEQARNSTADQPPLWVPLVVLDQCAAEAEDTGRGRPVAPIRGEQNYPAPLADTRRIDWRAWIALGWVAWFGLLYGKTILESRGPKIVELARVIGIRWD
jgi:hypothetical protein